MSKKSCCKTNCCCKSGPKLDACGCPTPRMCCGSMAVPTTAYQMVSVPQLVYDNVPAYPSCGGSNDGCFGDNWLLIILLLCCCGGGNFGGGCNDGCGDFGGSWIIILLLLCCCGGNGFGC